MEQFDLHKGRMAQLASPLDQSKISKYENDEHWMEPKLDGFRCIIKVHDDHVEVLSRTLKSMDGRAPHIEKLVSSLPAGTILDGEIGLANSWDANGDVLSFDFTGTTNIMRSAPKKAIERQKTMGPVTLVLFDVLQYDMKSLVEQTNERRRLVAKSIVTKLQSVDDRIAPYIKLSARYDVDTALIEKMLDDGLEGVMIKRADSPYLVGMRRVGTWFKIKMSDTADTVVMGYTEGDKEYTGNHADTHTYWFDEDNEVKILTAGGPPSKKDHPNVSDNVVPVGKYWFLGWVGAITFGQFRGDDLTYRGKCSGMSDEHRKEFTFDGSKYIGQVLEIKHNGINEEGKFRHPQFIGFRDDKSPEECDWS